jgi:hypothetical protein
MVPATGAPDTKVPSRRSPLVAPVLQFPPLLAPAAFLLLIGSTGPYVVYSVFGACVPYLGGFGYLYLGRWGRFLAASFGYCCLLAISSYLAASKAGIDSSQLRAILLGWGLAVIALSGVCAFDAWRLAQTRNKGPRPSQIDASARGREQRDFVGSVLIGSTVLIGVLVIGFVNFLALLLMGVSILCNSNPHSCP